MRVYYCEVAGKFEPYFPGYTTEAKTDEAAIEWFKAKHGVRLEMVYYEKTEKEMKIIWHEEAK
jgi:hypothetical protein